ncbi:MAG: cation:proton antiporter [Bacilli bacterium]|nr:cation:proton antiporter [Bacilli bacterium]
MFVSLSIIFLVGVLISIIFPKIRIPSLIGFLLLGIGMQYLGLMDDSLLDISSDIRNIALVIILLKAGLSLNFRDLKKVGRPAILLCFIPATFEIIAMAIVGPLMLGLSLVESLIIGTVLGAVSPAVVVVRMANLIDKKIGTKNSVPQMIIAGSSADDVYCIVLFMALVNMLAHGSGTNFDPMTLIKIPTSLIFGVGAGIILGLLCSLVFKKIHIRDTYKIIILIGLSVLLLYVEGVLDPTPVSLSSFLGVISMGIIVFARRPAVAHRLTTKFDKIWVFSEMFLFVFVGTSVKLETLGDSGLIFMLIAALVIAMVFRLGSTFLCLIKTPLTFKEKMFVAISEIPKATVQAAIGGTLIGMAGIESDYANLVLTISVLSILLFAPLGAILMDATYKALLVPKMKDNLINPPSSTV